MIASDLFQLYVMLVSYIFYRDPYRYSLGWMVEYLLVDLVMQ